MYVVHESGYTNIEDSPTIERYIFTFCKTFKVLPSQEEAETGR